MNDVFKLGSGVEGGDVTSEKKVQESRSDTPANSYVTKQPWQALNKYTAARIGLGRAGISVPTEHLLAFQLSHAQAQDAVHEPLNVGQLIHDIKGTFNTSNLNEPVLLLHSQVKDRAHYLQRPDLGRRLDDQSLNELKQYQAPQDKPYELAIVLVDGLSSLAIQKNAPELIELLHQRLVQEPLLTANESVCHLAPLVVVQQGRVAIGDEVAQCLNAKSVLVLIGERPGLSSPDSLGMYLTWAPKVGLTDDSRNCISNVRPDGLNYDEAINKLWYLLTESHQRKISGVNLKERASAGSIEKIQDVKNFLIS